ncbi:CoA pyrophosphatase, partial [Sinorhizobium meliloti]
MSSHPYSADEFRRRALQQAGGPIETSWRDHGDFLLNPGIVSYLESLHLKDAAVLVPVVDDGEDASVIFTQR